MQDIRRQQPLIVAFFRTLADNDNLPEIKSESGTTRKKLSPTFYTILAKFLAADGWQVKPALNLSRTTELSVVYTILDQCTLEDTVRYILIYLKQLIEALYHNVSSRNQIFCRTRKRINQRFGSIRYEVKRVLHISLPESEMLRLRYNAQVYETNVNQKDIADKKVVQVIQDMRSSPDWVNLMIVVALSVGSRMIEIVRVSNFELTEHPKLIRIVGVAKQKETDMPKVITKPVIGLRAKNVIDIVSFIRRTLSRTRVWGLGVNPDGTYTYGDYKTNQEISSTISVPLQKKVRELFGENFSFHKLRSVYAELAWKRQYKHLTMSKTAYYSYVLGHKPTSLTTALSYQRFDIKEDVKSEVAVPDPVLMDTVDVTFQDEFGNEFKVEPNPRRNYESEEKRLDRIRRQAATLILHGLKPTHTNLRKLRNGNDLISKLKEEEKKEASHGGDVSGIK
jgi:hypothetical protein